MIKDWRAKWLEGTGGQTDPRFPFGFVQLNSVGNSTVYNNPTDPGDPFSPAFGYAGLRWSQTAGYGYVPNKAMPAVFMATSLDTPDRSVPYPINGKPGGDPGFNVHSPFKQPVGARLARAGLAQAYGVPMETVGPLASMVTRATGNATSLVLTVTDVGAGVLPLRTSIGFEVCDFKSRTDRMATWHTDQHR